MLTWTVGRVTARHWTKRPQRLSSSSDAGDRPGRPARRGYGCGDRQADAAVARSACGGREGIDPELRTYVEARLEARQAARARRDFATADAIRAELEAKGIALADTGGGTSWKVVK